MNARCPHIVIFEPEVAGHPPFYIRLLYQALLCESRPLRVTFLIHPGISERLFSAEGLSLEPDKGRIEFHYLNDAEIAAANHKVLWIRALKRWCIMRRYLQWLQADHGHFLRLDHVQLPLALGLAPGRGRTVSGILFQPSTHSIYRSQFPSLKLRIRDLRKRLFYGRMLSNPALEKVFSLDPYYADEMNNGRCFGYKVCHLPDPSPDVIEGQEIKGFLPEALDRLIEERKIFLMFGSLTRRKGVFQLLDAIDRLDEKTASGSLFILAGKVAAEIAESLKIRIRDYHRKKPNGAYIHLENRYLPDAHIYRLVDRTDLVLAPYQRFVGSSGVLLWAAAAGKPVLTANYGLVGAMVRDYTLGWTVDTSRPEKISCALKAFCVRPGAFPRRTSGMARLTCAHLPELFGRTILAYLSRRDCQPSTLVAAREERALYSGQQREPIGG